MLEGGVGDDDDLRGRVLFGKGGHRFVELSQTRQHATLGREI